MRHLYLLLALLAGLTQLAAAQTLDPTFTSPASVYTSGAVIALGPAQADGKRLVAGNFRWLSGTLTGGLARLDASGAPDQAFARQVGVAAGVSRIRQSPGGQYLLGAQNGTVAAGGLTRTGALRLNADGSADAGFNAGTGPMAGTYPGQSYDYAVQPDGKVLVAGVFDTYSGVAANGLVRLNADGTPDPAFSVGSGISLASGDNPTTLVVLPGGAILVGGYFTTFGGVAVNGLVRLTASGSVDASFTNGLPAGAVVDALVVQPDGKVLVNFYDNTGDWLVRLLPSGALDTGFNVPASLGSIYAPFNFEPPVALLPNGQLLVTGNFGSSRVARLNSDGSVDNAFALNTQPITVPTALGVQPDGTILLGAADTYNLWGSPAGTLLAYTSSGTWLSAYPARPQVAGLVRTVVRQPGGELLVGGDFSEWNGQRVHHLVRLSSTGALDAAFSAAVGQLPSVVQTLAVQPDGRVLVGTGKGLLRLAATGTPDAGFSFFAGAVPITALAVQPDGRLLVGGTFGLGTSYSCLARTTVTGAQDNTFARPVGPGLGTPQSTDALWLQPDGRLVVAGRFRVPGAASGSYVVRYEASGAQDATFTPAWFPGNMVGSTVPYPAVFALAGQADGKVLVGGRLEVLGGTTTGTARSLARLSATGAPDASFAPLTSLAGTAYNQHGAVYSLAVQPNGRVLAGGNFVAANGTHLLRVLDDGQPDASFNSSHVAPNGVVFSLLVQPDGGIVLGGAFTTLGSQPAFGLARLTAPGVLAVAAPAAVAARTEAWPVPAHDLLRVLPDASAQPQKLELLDALGRVLRQQALAGPGEVALDVRGLPAGAYLLRVQYAQGSVVHRLTVE